MKKILPSILVALVMVMTSLTAFASSPTEKPMLRYYVDDSGMYKLSEKQFVEVTAKNNITEIVQRDGLMSVDSAPKTRASSENEFQAVVPDARTTGSWSITSNTIKSGRRTTYTKPNGGSFSVASGEELVCSIGPDEACYLTVGATGTKNFEVTEYIDLNGSYGVTIATSRVGSYKCYAGNDNDFSITVSGGISVS